MRTKVTALALAALFAASLAHAQLPRPNRPPRSMTAIRSYLSTATIGHTVTVAQSGADYTSIKAALDFVATQTRSDVNYWLVQVYPGTYQESNFTVPTFTHLMGVGDGRVGLTNTGVASGVPLIYDTTPTGVFCAVNEGASLSNLRFLAYDETGPITAAYTVIKANGRTSARNVEVGLDFDGSTAFAVTGVEAVLAAGAGGLYGDGLELVYFGGSSAAALLRATGAVAVNCYNCHFSRPGGTLAAYVSATSGATVRLFGTRVDAGATVDLVNSSSTIEVQSTPYATATGTVTSRDTIQSGATAPATCLVGQLFVDTDTGPSLCTCTASNVWKCAVVS